ncbi:lactonase family protein [Kushneria avicenniae]|nr:lactonase family protein [Kushneria avicenniae]
MNGQSGDTDHVLIDEIRRRLLKGMGMAAGAMALYPMLSATGAMAASSGSGAQYVYVGTYTGPNTAPGGVAPSRARGIYVFRMDPVQGGLTPVQTMAAENPSFLALSPDRRYLYSVNELGPDADGNPLGRVSAYRIAPDSGELTFINTRLTGGTWTCHCSVHPSGRYLFAANYGTGSFSVFPLGDNGEILEMSDLVESPPNGQGPDGVRQEGAHAHMMITGRGAITSSVSTLPVDSEFGRPMFNPDNPGEVPTGSNTTAELRIHPQGRFLYATNRGMNSIAVFRVDDDSGQLINTGWVSSGGEIPRGMNLDPTGRFLYVGNQNSDTIKVFNIDPQSGALKGPVHTIDSPVPVDFAFNAAGG